MAINKKLIHFKTKTSFQQELAKNNILSTSIVFIQDTNEIWTHGTYYATKLTVSEIENIVTSSTNVSDFVKRLMPKRISELQNDLQFATKTEAQNYTDNAIAALVDSAPDSLNTINELAIAINNNKEILETLDEAITSKASKEEAIELYVWTYNGSGNTTNYSALKNAIDNDKLIYVVNATSINVIPAPASVQYDANSITLTVLQSHDAIHTYTITSTGIVTQTRKGVQQGLVSGTNIKTLNGTSLLGSGNIEINPELEIININSNNSANSGSFNKAYAAHQSGKLVVFKQGSTYYNALYSVDSGKFTLNYVQHDGTKPILYVAEFTSDDVFVITSSVDLSLTSTINGINTKIGQVEAKIPTKLSQLTNDGNFVKDANYVHTDNNFTDVEQQKLENLENYVLQPATSNVLGGVKIGNNISNSSGTISITKENVTAALGYTPPVKDTTYNNASTSQAGLMSVEDKVKLNSIAGNAEVNQNAFSSVKVGSTTITADSKTDTLNLAAGSNITLTPDSTNDTVTITAKDTTYGIANTTSDGLMSASDKSKLDGIAVGANAYSLPNATSSVLGGVKVGSNISVSSGTISLTKANVTTALGYTPPTSDTTYSAGTGLNLSGTTFSADGSAIINALSEETSTAQRSDYIVAQYAGGGTTNTSYHRKSVANLFAALNKSDVTTALGYTPPTTNTTYVEATGTKAGLMSASDKTKLDTISTNADNVSISQKLTSGTEVGTITINGTDTKLYAPTNTTYTFASGTNGFTVTPSNGSAQTVSVTPSISNNVTYTGTLIDEQVVTFEGTSGQIKASGFTIGKSVPSNAVFTDTKYSAGNGLTISGTTMAVGAGAGISVSADAVGLATSGVTAGTYGDDEATRTLTHSDVFDVPQITVDAYGRITSASTKTLTLPASGDTHYTTGINVGASGATSNSAQTDPYLTVKDNSTYRSQIQLKGGGATVVSSDDQGVVTISSTNTTYSAGSGISQSGTTFSHADTSSLSGSYGPTANVTGTDGTTIVIPQITVDGYGHVTGITNRTYTSKDSNTTYSAMSASELSTGTAETSRSITAKVLSEYVKGQIDSKIAAADAMIYKGTIGTNGTITALPNTHSTGWTYKVITAGTYAGKVCEIGDMIICLTDGTAANNDHWTVVQNNTDGVVTGPSSVTSGRIAVFNGTTGKVIKDSGYTIATSVPSGAVFTDTHWTTGIAAGGSGATANASTSNPYITIRDNSTYRGQVRLVGSGATTVSSDASGNITISSTDNNTWRGITDSVSTSDSTISGSATAVKTAYDKAVSAYNLANGKTSNTGTVTSVATGVGLTGGSITTSGTVKAKLRSETALTVDSAAATTTSGRVYPVAVDKTGYLAVNVPWSNTTYSSKSAASGGTDVSLVTTGEKYTWNAKASTSVATTSANGLMSSGDKSKLDGIASGATAVSSSTVSGWGFTKNTGTVTSVATGVGLTGGSITGSGTIKAKLKSETASTLDSASMGSTSGRQYAVGVDKSGYLSVNVPWTDTTYTLSSLGISNVKNYDQSKAIKSITRSGTTFTYTCLDGTTGTFTQQDNNTTYSVATTSANGLMSKDDKAKLDKMNAGSTTATSITSLSVDYSLVVANISASATLGFSKVPVAGKCVHVIIKNTGSSAITITLPTSGNYICTGDSSLSVSASKYAEINAVSDGSKIYLRGIS